jgi:glycosyltransferase involved in cell wall biosynthesis
MSGALRKTIGLVVPSILDDGGVPAVARFVKNSIRRCGEFDLRVISLATAAGDDCSVRLRSPTSWRRGVSVRRGRWDGEDFSHVGAFVSELEWQRFRPRRALAGLLEECDVIQVVGGCPAWALPVLGAGKPVALQVATRAIVERRRLERIERGPRAWWHKAMTRITNRLDDRALACADAILVENPWMMEYARTVRNGTDCIIRYAPPGIDLATFHPLPVRRPCDPSSRYILAVGRFDDPRKNGELLLRSFARVNRKLSSPPRLVLAGADPGTGFWHRARSLGLDGRIEFHQRPDLPRLVSLFQSASCLALTSDEEGFGVVVVEAMGCGVPVVATRCGGPDGIISDAVDGFLVPLDADEMMADRLAALCENAPLNLRMGAAARDTAERRYSEQVAAEPFLETYRSLLLRDPGRG